MVKHFQKLERILRITRPGMNSFIECFLLFFSQS